MGSSDTGTSTGVGDCTVGSIVWVRRRNGSWWPGKILGEEDLSGSHVLSPRSGTPVKLLGREDASVDWYNMEKSKRVKAFRCGEFDDCIDKAESSLGMPPKKREKYARREDAIIHALELEKQFLEKQYGKLGSSSNHKSGKSSDVKKELATSAESLRHGNGNGKCVDRKYHQLSGEVDLPHKGITSSHLQIQEVKEVKQQSGDDVNSDVLPRMRGLQDLGFKTASPKRKIPSVDSNGPSKSPLDESSRAPLNGSGASTGNAGDANDKAFSAKRKRSNEGLAGDSIVKRRDKCRPLVQVLESSAMFQVPPSPKPEENIVSLHAKGEEQTGVEGSAKRSKHVDQTKSIDSTDDSESRPKDIEGSPFKLEDNNNSPADLLQENTSGSTENTETDSSETDSLESDTDEAMADISDESIEFRPKSMVKSEVQEEDRSINTEEPDDPATTSDTSHPSNDDILASVGVSKWQQKRKRNTRALTKRFVNISGGKVSREINQGTKCKGKGSYGSDEMGLVDKKYGTLLGGYGSKVLNGIGHNISSWGGSIEHKIPVSAGRRFGDRRKCMLVDVDLKVQSNYQREHVPMISLMSKINGQAIVGHPIQIETLEYGSTEALLAAADDELNQDPDTSVPPMWRTARRTANCRVPRPSSLSMMDGDEVTEHLQAVHQDKKARTNRSNGGKSSVSKSSARGSRPTHKKLRKKPAKKTGVSSNQKTRTLASIATQQKPINHLKHGASSGHVNGLVKPESVSAAGACIPVKLVFNRLHEDLVGGHQ